MSKNEIYTIKSRMLSLNKETLDNLSQNETSGLIGGSIDAEETLALTKAGTQLFKTKFRCPESAQCATQDPNQGTCNLQCKASF